VEEGYIAVSPEIDETLGKYISIIVNECETARLKERQEKEWSAELEGKLFSYRNATFWKRLKYLFTGRMKIEEGC
jgi:hypothetical protein